MGDQGGRKLLAKKVLFLFPPSVIQEQMVDLLVQTEYEVGLLTDPDRVVRVCQAHPSTIVFCNIDHKHFDEAGWETYVRGLLALGPACDARVGIITYDPDPRTASRYLMDIGATCGYIGLKLGLKESARIVLKMLEANEARGGRRFVRVRCPPGKSVFNLNLVDGLHHGTILDLSSVGLACLFQEPVDLKPMQVYADMQLQLWGARLHEPVTLMGTRMQEGVGLVYIFMFEEFQNHDSKAKLYTFIRKAVQADIDAI